MPIFVQNEANKDDVKGGQDAQKQGGNEEHAVNLVDNKEAKNRCRGGVCPEFVLEESPGEEYLYDTVEKERESPKCLIGEDDALELLDDIAPHKVARLFGCLAAEEEIED